MTPENKYRVNLGLKALGLFVWAILTFATCAGVWNVNVGVSLSVLAGALLVANVFVIILIVLSIKSPEIEDFHFENPIDLKKKK